MAAVALGCGTAILLVGLALRPDEAPPRLADGRGGPAEPALAAPAETVAAPADTTPLVEEAFALTIRQNETFYDYFLKILQVPPLLNYLNS